jgi:hypothetical protein
VTTGAESAHVGLVEQAGAGTLFLDEVSPAFYDSFIKHMHVMLVACVFLRLNPALRSISLRRGFLRGRIVPVMVTKPSSCVDRPKKPS